MPDIFLQINLKRNFYNKNHAFYAKFTVSLLFVTGFSRTHCKRERIKKDPRSLCIYLHDPSISIFRSHSKRTRSRSRIIITLIIGTQLSSRGELSPSFGRTFRMEPNACFNLSLGNIPAWPGPGVTFLITEINFMLSGQRLSLASLAIASQI